MRAVPVIDLARPTNVCCIVKSSSLGVLLASTYSSSEGSEDRQGSDIFSRYRPSFRGALAFSVCGDVLDGLFWTVDRLLPVSPIRLLMKLIDPATRLRN